MAFTMDTVIPQFSGLDGLKYDATVVALEGKVIPIAFSETITHARDGARFNTFTSARGVQSISYRGDAPRSLSVAVNKVPWKYVATVIALESMQRKPLYLMEVINTKNAHIYGREASLPAGVVYRFRAGVQASAGATATVGLVGFDKNGNKVWESPDIRATSNWEVKTSNRFIIPEGVSYVRDYYEAGLRSFSPIQLWIGEHEPPPAPRMGGTFQIADLSFTEAPSTKAKLYDVSYTLKEVAP